MSRDALKEDYERFYDYVKENWTKVALRTFRFWHQHVKNIQMYEFIGLSRQQLFYMLNSKVRMWIVAEYALTLPGRTKFVETVWPSYSRRDPEIFDSFYDDDTALTKENDGKNKWRYERQVDQYFADRFRVTNAAPITSSTVRKFVDVYENRLKTIELAKLEDLCVRVWYSEHKDALWFLTEVLAACAGRDLSTDQLMLMYGEELHSHLSTSNYKILTEKLDVEATEEERGSIYNSDTLSNYRVDLAEMAMERQITFLPKHFRSSKFATTTDEELPPPTDRPVTTDDSTRKIDPLLKLVIPSAATGLFAGVSVHLVTSTKQ